MYPKLTGGGQNFGGGASPGVMSALAGRLLCDTYLLGEGEGKERGGYKGGRIPAAMLATPPPSSLPINLRCHVTPPPSSPSSARELVREVDYTLRTLSASLLGQVRGGRGGGGRAAA